LAPATAAEETDHGHPSDIYFYGDIYADAKELAADLNIKPTKENLEKMIYGNCAMTYLKKGAGEIFAAGTCYYVTRPIVQTRIKRFNHPWQQHPVKF
jgi:hypothetical protein